MNILVLQPIRPSNPPALRAVADALLARLPAANPGLTFDIRQDDAALDIPPHPSLYMRHATIRNYMLDTYLQDAHDAVLWIDSDLVEYPADLPTTLAGAASQPVCRCGGVIQAEGPKLPPGVSASWAIEPHCSRCDAPRPYQGAIVAPMAVLSPTSGWQERFYDIGGFIERGARARMWQPWFDQRGDVIELDSVGCCYLAPAALYRDGVRYSPPPTDYYVEHWSVMQQARQRGYRICALATVRAVHAWLPDYGLQVN